MNFAVDKQGRWTQLLKVTADRSRIPPADYPGYWEGIVDYAPSYDPKKAKEPWQKWVGRRQGWQAREGWPEVRSRPFDFPSDSWGRAAQVVQEPAR